MVFFYFSFVYRRKWLWKKLRKRYDENPLLNKMWKWVFSASSSFFNLVYKSYIDMVLYTINDPECKLNSAEHTGTVWNNTTKKCFLINRFHSQQCINFIILMFSIQCKACGMCYPITNLVNWCADVKAAIVYQCQQQQLYLLSYL